MRQAVPSRPVRAHGVTWHRKRSFEDQNVQSKAHDDCDRRCGDGRGTQGKWWRDPEGWLIVTISVVVDSESQAAHVDRFVHERFE